MMMGSVSSWWQELLDFQQAMFMIACVTTLFLVIQIVLMLIGLGGDDAAFDMDTSLDDVDVFNNEGISDMVGLKLISVRTVVAFLCLGSWVTFLLLFWLPWYGALFLGLSAGTAAAVGVAYAMKAAMQLQYSGNIRLENAIGKVGDVYLTIPAKRAGMGKINVLVQETYIEREAITDNAYPIKTGEKIRIIDVIDQGTVIVAPLLAPTDEAKK